MIRAKAFLAIILLIIFSASIAVGSPLNVQPTKIVSLQSAKSILSPQINILDQVSPDLDKFNYILNLTAEVTCAGQDICGLNESNFKLDIPVLSIYSVSPLKGPTQKYPGSTCFYDIVILPGHYQGRQWIWFTHKNYTTGFKIIYISNGKEIARKTIALSELDLMPINHN